MLMIHGGIALIQVEECIVVVALLGCWILNIFVSVFYPSKKYATPTPTTLLLTAMTSREYSIVAAELSQILANMVIWLHKLLKCHGRLLI